MPCRAGGAVAGPFRSARRGIGSGVSRVFAQAGSDIAIVYRGNQERAARVADEAMAIGRRASIDPVICALHTDP